MLAVVKEPHIEISLSGAGDGIEELLAYLRSRYAVEVLTPATEDESEEVVQDVLLSDFWRQTTPGDLLAGFRLKHGLTQEELAEKSGIHQVVISAYETGKRKLSRKAAMKFAKALAEAPDKFFPAK